MENNFIVFLFQLLNYPQHIWMLIYKNQVMIIGVKSTNMWQCYHVSHNVISNISDYLEIIIDGNTRNI